MKLDKFRLLLLTTLVACAGQLHAENQIVTLQSVFNNKYVRAGVGSGTLLAAVSPHRRGWEKFEKIDLGGGIIALKSVQNGKMVRAGIGSKTLLGAVSPHTRGWEKFKKIRLRGVDVVALRSVQNGKYVRVDPANGSLLSATAIRISDKTKFHLRLFKTPSQDKVTLKVKSVGRGLWDFTFDNKTNKKVKYWIYTNHGRADYNHKRECVVEANTKTMCEARANININRSYWITKKRSSNRLFEGTLP